MLHNIYYAYFNFFKIRKLNFHNNIKITIIIFMQIIENVLKSNLFSATYRYNIYINIIYCDYYKVTFGTKGRVWARNHRDLVDIRETIEVILEKHNNYNKQYLYNIIEMGQEGGLAYMTNPKTISSLYHTDLKRMYNDIIHWRPYTSHNGIITV